MPEPPSDPVARGDRGIEMAAGNVADGADHDGVRQAVGERNAQCADGRLRRRRGDIGRRKSLRQRKKSV